MDDLSNPSLTFVPKFERFFAFNIIVANLHKNSNAT